MKFVDIIQTNKIKSKKRFSLTNFSLKKVLYWCTQTNENQIFQNRLPLFAYAKGNSKFYMGSGLK